MPTPGFMAARVRIRHSLSANGRKQPSDIDIPPLISKRLTKRLRKSLLSRFGVWNSLLKQSTSAVFEGTHF